MSGKEITGRLNGDPGVKKMKRIPVSEAIENLSSNTGVRAHLAREKIRFVKSEDLRQKDECQTSSNVISMRIRSWLM
jgi:hypothetical protein